MFGLDSTMIEQAGKKLVELEAFTKRQDGAMQALLQIVDAQTQAMKAMTATNNQLVAQVEALNLKLEKETAQ